MISGAYFFAFAANVFNVPLATPALLQAGFAAALIGGLASMRSFLQMLATPLWASIADARGNTRAMAFRGQVSLVIAMVLLAYAASPTWLIVGYFVFGFLGGGSTTLIDSLNILTHDRHRFGVVRLFGTVGYAATFLLMGQVGPLGQRNTFLCAAAMSGVAALSLIGPRSPPSTKRARLDWSLLKNQGVMRVTVFAALQWASHSAFTVFMLPLGKARGIAPDTIAYTIVLGLGVEVIMMRYSGALFHRFGGPRLLLTTCLVAMLRWAGLWLTKDTASFVALHALHGISFGLFYPTAVHVCASAAPPEQKVTAQALLTSVGFGLGGSLGSLLAGFAFDRLGADATWGVMVIPAGIALVLTREQKPL